MPDRINEQNRSRFITRAIYGMAYGPIRKPTGNYTLVRLKRGKRRSKYNVAVEKKSIDGRWIKLGDFATEDQALEFLEDEVETMDLIEQLKELDK